jgi:hypothetical protein
MTVIALTGYAGAGKDTVGKILVEQHGFTRVAFADRLKAMALELDPILEVVDDSETRACARLSEIIDLYGGLDEAKKLPAVREFLQKLGVSARNHIHPDVWVNAALSIADAHNTLGSNVVITDCRFKNEAGAVVAAGGQVWRVVRPGVEAVNGHVSEHDLDDWPIDGELVNSGTIEELAGFVGVLARVRA